MDKYLLYKTTLALRCPQPDPPTPPNSPTSSPLPDASPPAGQGQAANAAADPPQMPAPPSSAGASPGTAVGWQLPSASTAPDSGSREPWEVEVEATIVSGWVGAAGFLGAVLCGTGYIIIQAVKVFKTSL